MIEKYGDKMFQEIKKENAYQIQQWKTDNEGNQIRSKIDLGLHGSRKCDMIWNGTIVLQGALTFILKRMGGGAYEEQIQF